MIQNQDYDQQQAPQIRSSPYMAPMHQYGSSIILLTNPENEIYKMELTFRNVKVDKEGNETPAGEPLMNDIGITSVVGSVQSIVNQVTVMSNLSKPNILMLIEFLGDTLAKDLMINRTVYDIKSVSSRDKIFFTALSTAFITMQRAYEEGDKRFWKGSVQEIHSRVEASNAKNKGILSSLNPWSKS